MYVTGMKYFLEKTSCSPPENLYVSENCGSHWKSVPLHFKWTSSFREESSLAERSMIS